MAFALAWGTASNIKALEVEGKNFSISYKEGLLIKSDDEKYSLKTNVLIQIWHQYLGVEGPGDTNDFRVRRARLSFKGEVFHPDLKYFFHSEFAGTTGGATANLLDGYIDWQGWEPLQFKAGQFKVPFTREFLTPGWALQFVDRSIVNTALGLDRDLGLDIHGNSFENRLNYDLFVMNGDGRNRSNRNNEMIVGGRFTLNILGKLGYWMSDVWYSEEPHLAFAVATLYDFGNALLGENDLIRLTGDVALRYKGFSFLGEGHFVRNTTNNQSDFGFLEQAGYFIVPKHFEVAVRGAGVLNDAIGALRTGSVNTYETGIAFNYFFFGQQVKLQTDYNVLWNNGGTQNRNDHQIRTQAQLLF